MQVEQTALISVFEVDSLESSHRVVVRMAEIRHDRVLPAPTRGSIAVETDKSEVFKERATAPFTAI